MRPVRTSIPYALPVLTWQYQQPFVTEVDLRHALVPPSAIEYLLEAMPPASVGDPGAYDYDAFLGQLFSE